MAGKTRGRLRSSTTSTNDTLIDDDDELVDPRDVKRAKLKSVPYTEEDDDDEPELNGGRESDVDKALLLFQDGGEEDGVLKSDGESEISQEDSSDSVEVVDVEDERYSSDEETCLDIPFSIPVHGADKTFIVASNTSYSALRRRLGDIIGLMPDHVSVAWRFSHTGPKGTYNHLSNNDELAELFDCYTTALEDRTKALAKAKKTGKAIPKIHREKLKVELKNLRPETAEMTAKDKGKEKGKQKVKGKKKASTKSPPSIEEFDVQTDKPRSGSQFTTKILLDNPCSKKTHPGPCLDIGDMHINLLPAQTSLWGNLCAKGWPSTTSPPTTLKIGDAPPPSRKPVTVDQPTAAPAPPTYHAPPTVIWAGAPPTTSPYARSSRPAGPASDGFEIELMEPRLYPKLVDWAKELEGSTRGDGYEYCLHAQALSDAGYNRIVDIESLGLAEIKAECPSIASGVANKLIRYAKADTAKIRAEEKGRLRQERNQPRYYN
ncbi:hypothetical protein BDZ89DRAFT_1144675 [Hymenopellis radicata]|nr:hypothetical protein BDZ89DRAFT_1144675 [Hymenopellis radicata]